MEFGWVIQPSSRAGLRMNELMEQNRRFLRLLSGKFVSAWVEDHFQWDNRDTLECWTTLTFLASEFREYVWGPLVLGQSYRNPALIAKMAANLCALTNGRMVFGIGAGWKKDEYLAYGYDFPRASVRIEQLEEAVQIIRALWTQAPATFHGKYYHIEKAYCEPRPNPMPPFMIGGSGEQKTLRVVARYADWWNGSFQPPEEYARKLAALRKHCDELGRDFDSVRKTYFGFVSLSDDPGKLVKRDDLYVISGNATQVTQTLEQFRTLGVEFAILRFLDFPDTRGAEIFLESVLPHLR